MSEGRAVGATWGPFLSLMAFSSVHTAAAAPAAWRSRTSPFLSPSSSSSSSSSFLVLLLFLVVLLFLLLLQQLLMLLRLPLHLCSLLHFCLLQLYLRLPSRTDHGGSEPRLRLRL